MDFIPNPKRKRKLEPSPTVLAEAQRLYKDHLSHQTFPEDHWLAINNYWDLNLYTDEKGLGKATLYPVIDDNTDTSQPFPVLGERVKD